MSVTISGLPAATALTGAELVPIVQASTTKRATTQDIANLATIDLANATGTLLPTHGGTGLSTYVQGDLIYATNASVLASLAKNVTATRYLSNTGTNNNPAWAQIDLTNGVSGALPIENGGTGQSIANDALNALLPDQSGQGGNFLTTDGSNSSWAAASGGAPAPDLVFIAANVGGTPGYSEFGTTGGTLIFKSLRLSTVYGFGNLSINIVAPSELEFEAEGEFASDAFTTLEIGEFGQSFASADALFSVFGGKSTWHWNSADSNGFVVGGQYYIFISGAPA